MERSFVTSGVTPFIELSSDEIDGVYGGRGIGKVSSDGAFGGGATLVGVGVAIAPETFGAGLLLALIGGAMMGLAIA